MSITQTVPKLCFCVCMCLYVGAGVVCGGQRTILNVSPQVVPTFLFETGSLTGLEITHIGQASWPLRFQDLPVSISHFTVVGLTAFVGPMDPNSDPHAYKARPLLTEPFPQ